MKKQFPLINLLFIFLSTMFIASIITIISLKPYIKLSELLDDFIYGIPFYIYLMIILVIFSIILSFFLYYGLRKEQKTIVRKLQCIIIGDYQHAIFKSKINRYSPFSSHLSIIDEQINKINFHFIEINENLKQFRKNDLPLNNSQRENIITAEKHHIARELHDSVSQQLYAATMMISALPFTVTQLKNNISSIENDETTVAHFSQLEEQINLIDKIILEAQNELRALLLHLRPINLKNSSLAKGVVNLLEELKIKTSIEITYDVKEVSLSNSVENHLFRILQELISNVLRHAKATHLEIYLQEIDNHVILRVFDNGIGFNTTKVREGSYGLTNIKERITSLGGSINITSLTNQGTSIDIRI